MGWLLPILITLNAARNRGREQRERAVQAFYERKKAKKKKKPFQTMKEKLGAINNLRFKLK